MTTRPLRRLALLAAALAGGCGRAGGAEPAGGEAARDARPDGTPYPVRHTDEEWRALLTPEEYRVLRLGGTEPRGTGDLLDVEDPGVYVCAACGAVLFRSDDKFHSGSGWPSFTRPAASLVEVRDTSLGMVRTEVRCPRCGGHLGHVFPDGPPPTGLRCCIDSAALDFRPADAPARPASR